MTGFPPCPATPRPGPCSFLLTLQRRQSAFLSLLNNLRGGTPKSPVCRRATSLYLPHPPTTSSQSGDRTTNSLCPGEDQALPDDTVGNKRCSSSSTMSFWHLDSIFFSAGQCFAERTDTSLLQLLFALEHKGALCHSPPKQSWLSLSFWAALGDEYLLLGLSILLLTNICGPQVSGGRFECLSLAPVSMLQSTLSLQHSKFDSHSKEAILAASIPVSA